MANRYLSLESRFWLKVEKFELGCWLWVGKTNKDNYGIIKHCNRYRRANRVSWVIHFGNIPPGKFVLHRCDNPKCVNPNHLFLGTQADNIADMVSKGRNLAPGAIDPVVGEQHGRSKLTEKDVIEIRKWYVPRRGVGQLAAKFGISRSHVARLVNGINWKHI